MEEISPEITNDDYDFAVKSTHYQSIHSVEKWYAHARALYAAAKQTWTRVTMLDEKIIGDKIALVRVYFMLAGMSLEALMKSNIISKIPENERELSLPKKLKTHDLTKLADIMGIKLEEDQKYCLEILTQYIVWSGRYPAPNEHGDNYIFMNLDHKKIIDTLYCKLSIPFDITS